MTAYDLNWDALDNAITTKRAKYAFDDVKHLFKKIAFDVYKPLNGSTKLWELREEDGGKFLYALYEEPEEITVQAEKTASWNAVSDKGGDNITLSYKDVPIMRFASDRYKFKPEEADLFAEFVKSKTSDKKFLDRLMKILPENKRRVLAEIRGV